MNQRPFSPVTGEPFKVENYYFQIIMNRLVARRPVSASLSQFTFTVFKDNHKYETTKVVTLQIGSATQYSLEGEKINFVAISYNPNKSLAFALRIIESSPLVNKEIGEYLIDANNFIDHFAQTQNGAFTLRINFNDDWAADIELYVEKSRYGVERLIRQLKNPKAKAQTLSSETPLSHQTIKENRRNLKLQQKQEEQVHRTGHFTKFSPKREVKEEVPRKNYFNSKKQEQPVKKEVAPPVQAPKKQVKKEPKAEFVPKKQWIIPEAEKYIANKKNISKNTPKNTSERTSRIAQQKPLPVKSQKSKSKPIEQPSLLEKIPMQPKYLILIAIVVLLAFIVPRFLSSDTPQVPPKAPPIQTKEKKQSGKSEKPKKVKK